MDLEEREIRYILHVFLSSEGKLGRLDTADT